MLNRFYQPVNVVNVRRALCMFYVGVAHALDEEYQLFDFDSWRELSEEMSGDSINSASCIIKVPRIIVLQACDRMPIGRVRFSRRNIFMRDDDTCQYCGQRFSRKLLSLDHVIPRSQCGKTHWTNIVASCIPCNSKKGGRTPSQAKMRLLKEPKEPSWSELRNLIGPRLLYKQWLPFFNPIDAAYWNTELASD